MQSMAGAWQAVSDRLEGYMVCTDTHYSMLCVEKARKPFRSEHPTESEEAAAYRSIRAGAGTYQISGNLMTLNEETDRNPNGHPVISGIRLDGDYLIETSLGPDNPEGVSFTWKKVKSANVTPSLTASKV